MNPFNPELRFVFTGVVGFYASPIARQFASKGGTAMHSACSSTKADLRRAR